MHEVPATSVNYAALDAEYSVAFCTEDGDILPPCSWMEVLGIEQASATRWALEQLKGLLESYEADPEHAGMTDGELVLVSGVDMFLAGLAMGLVCEGRIPEREAA